MTVAGIGLVLVAPIMAITALLVRLESKGPIFFKQERVGQDSRPFMVLKFRSMRDRAEAETGPCFTSANDATFDTLRKILAVKKALKKKKK